MPGRVAVRGLVRPYLRRRPARLGGLVWSMAVTSLLLSSKLLSHLGLSVCPLFPEKYI